MKAFIFGAGAHGRTLLDMLRAQGRYESIEFLDDDEHLWGKELNGVPIAGNLDYACGLDRSTFEMVIALGNPISRFAVAKKAAECSISLLNVVHSSAVIMPSATIGKGNVICAGAVIDTGTTLGDIVVVHMNSVVSHDSVLADGAYVAPQVMIGGRVTLHRGAFICMGAVVFSRLSIGAFSVVAAGSVVTRDVPARVLVRGTPARIVEKVDEVFEWRRLL